MMAENDSEILAVTRVYVSGLPPSLTKDQLRSHFADKYPVTDAHVIPDRRIGFVGFTTHENAKSAANYFNKTFIRMSKISVTLAKPVEVRRDPSGQAAPVSQRSLRHKERNQDGAELSSKKRKRDIHDTGENDQPTASSTNIKLDAHGQHQEGVNPSDHVMTSENNTMDVAEDAPRSDTDWLRGKTSRLLDLVEQEGQDSHTALDNAPVTNETVPHVVEDAAGSEDKANSDAEARTGSTATVSIPNARLFIRNLPFDAKEGDLRKTFAPFGRVSEVHIVTDTRKLTGKGLAYVQFVEPADAEKALLELDGRDFQGRLMHILPASEKKVQKLSEYELSKLPLKKQKAIKRKNEATSSTFSWNSLYMNPDAVLASVADRLGVSKSELLDPSSADAAVKQAHAETSVIKETKDYLKSSGVNIDAFKNRSRDDRTILLKNFSFGTTSEELSQMLNQYGDLERLVFPTTGVMAVAQYRDPAAASLALKQLAYRNLRGSVLYLEKAPEGLWEHAAPLPADLGTQTQQVPEDAESKTLGSTFTVFVRNLNFSTTTARLSEAFKPLSGFLSARVKTRTDAKRPGEILSMGFGFVEFRTRAQAEAAIATMNGRRLDGHELLVQLSQKVTDLAEERRKEDIAKKLDSNKTKIVIKNLPFEATKKDIRALFGAYGQLRTVRLPKKFDNSARGFAFAEFVTPKEAENAMEALSNTHLLGRRLVLDFAEGEAVDPEAEIQAMEKKVQHSQDTLTHHRMTGSVRKKFNIGAGDDVEPL
ncbi:Multiple RNA-binding domain-containing protein 1 [Exophiala dermatitidis]|uniref:Multiple RNA-binding domain-containing protein 1 n=2 Tax=Exophiala dermatitidis TaxID=5970 RepID=H6C1H2_EXODN|nr:nucleolin [Exophiala dermatitidis NIH/UT8656]KAJ4516028.1 Multiple RNA-binding domain-containing protein 1 [Exophiala dermatitidis]EHY57757.1 nucleolin [Exophiala dermatitidis NIH/UT8656]KAJ4518567.1 Multiple RNA-binding domain-containing protein 1 [Exophiala dermatitidis]KAJ4534071.1 Multiple RNA-binding domain-containing protein 1 [Exophiala dermatitidis]KAJ4550224.1 Multiple RNA-binding domain-containing protein 1 [Exophiala dermatitidis]